MIYKMKCFRILYVALAALLMTGCGDATGHFFEQKR